MQLCVFRFSLLQDGDVRIGVFPEGEEILIKVSRFFLVAYRQIASPQLQPRQRPQRRVKRNTLVVEDLLKFRYGLAFLPHSPVPPGRPLPPAPMSQVAGFSHANSSPRQ